MSKELVEEGGINDLSKIPKAGWLALATLCITMIYVNFKELSPSDLDLALQRQELSEKTPIDLSDLDLDTQINLKSNIVSLLHFLQKEEPIINGSNFKAMLLANGDIEITIDGESVMLSSNSKTVVESNKKLLGSKWVKISDAIVQNIPLNSDLLTYDQKQEIVEKVNGSDYSETHDGDFIIADK